MTIKQQGGIFGRNPTFNNVTANDLTAEGTVEAATRVTTPIITNGATAGTLTIGAGAAQNTGANILMYGEGHPQVSDFLFRAGTTGLVRIQDSGEVKIINGNLRFDTAGTGIDFSATAGTGTSELFDDYEEGTWTPTFSDSGTGGTTTGTGVYTKVGNKVTVHAVINDIDTTGLTAANKAHILGFPFAATSLQSVIGNVWFSGGVTTSGACFVYLQTGLSYARFFESPYAGTGDILSVSAFTDDAADLNINITYIAS